MTRAREHWSADELAEIAMGSAEDRAEVEAHAKTCAACDAEWKRASRLAALMGTLATPPPPSEKSLARARARVRALMAISMPAAEPRPAAPALDGWMAGAAVLVSVVLAFSLSGPAISAARVIVAIATIGIAALLPSVALRSEREAIGATIGALGLSAGLALLDYAEWPLVAGHAIGCLSTEMVIGALPLLAMVAMSRARGARLGSFASAATGAAGALAGQGVLLTTCAADESVLHVLFFHFAGVALATLVGGGLGALVSRRA